MPYSNALHARITLTALRAFRIGRKFFVRALFEEEFHPNLSFSGRLNDRFFCNVRRLEGIAFHQTKPSENKRSDKCWCKCWIRRKQSLYTYGSLLCILCLICNLDIYFKIKKGFDFNIVSHEWQVKRYLHPQDSKPKCWQMVVQE